MKTLDGLVAIVTGSGTGIGRAIALLFASEGASVVVANRTAAAGAKVVEEIRAAGGEARLCAVDLSSRTAVQSLISETVASYGKLDIVLHNAAAMIAKPIDQLTDDDLHTTFATNVDVAFWFISEALELLKASTNPRLLITSSIIGNQQMLPLQGAYGTSKAALNGFIRQAAYELAATGITVNGVEPGFIVTERFQEILSPEQIAENERFIPRQQAGTPEDIAHAFLFLASPHARHVTGQTIAVDGGQGLGRAIEVG